MSLRILNPVCDDLRTWIAGWVDRTILDIRITFHDNRTSLASLVNKPFTSEDELDGDDEMRLQKHDAHEKLGHLRCL